MGKSILWCTGYYTNDYCKVKAKEIREAIKQGDPRWSKYEKVAIVDKVMDYSSKISADGTVSTSYEKVQFNRIRLYYAAQ